MNNLDIKKKLVNDWFNYLQLEICKNFQNIDIFNHKFIKFEFCHFANFHPAIFQQFLVSLD